MQRGVPIPRACPNACAHHVKFIENLLTAEKNLLLQSRMETVCLKSVRAKVLRYLKSFAPDWMVSYYRNGTHTIATEKDTVLIVSHGVLLHGAGRRT